MGKQNRVTAVGLTRVGHTPYVTFVRQNTETYKANVKGYRVCEKTVKRLVNLLCTSPYSRTGHTVPMDHGWATTFR